MQQQALLQKKLLNLEDLRDEMKRYMTHKNMARLSAASKGTRMDPDVSLTNLVVDIETKSAALQDMAYALQALQREVHIIASAVVDSFMRSEFSQRHRILAATSFHEFFEALKEAMNISGKMTKSDEAVLGAATLVAAFAEDDATLKGYLAGDEATKAYLDHLTRLRYEDLISTPYVTGDLKKKVLGAYQMVFVKASLIHKKALNPETPERQIVQFVKTHVIYPFKELLALIDVYLVQKREIISMVDKIGNKDLSRAYHRTHYREPAGFMGISDFKNKTAGRPLLRYDSI